MLQKAKELNGGIMQCVDKTQIIKVTNSWSRPAIKGRIK